VCGHHCIFYLIHRCAGHSMTDITRLLENPVEATTIVKDTAKSMSSLISSHRKYRISFSGLVYVIIVVSFRIVMMSWFHSIQYCPLLQRRFQTMEIDIRDDTGSTVTFERGRVVVTFHISPSLPSTGTIPNNGTWASPTILGSTKGQYTYREFNTFLTSATQSETYSPVGNIAF
jgi:hypothetical protein